MDHGGSGWSMVHRGPWANAGGRFIGVSLATNSRSGALPRGLGELEEVSGLVTRG
jgi:hypothetical protein